MNQLDKVERLRGVSQAIEECKKCSLWKNPKAVPGEGSPEAEILVIGEAPGYHESIQGRPFVGAAGQLLTQLLKSINIERSQVFICNMLRHRPPENREPLPEEIEACKDYLDRQIEIIQPKMIVTLGRFSMMKFIPDGKISQIHGMARMVEFKGRKIMVLPMFHPAAALRGDDVMRKLKADFFKIPILLKGEEKVVEVTSGVKIEESTKTEDPQLSLL